MSDADLEAFLEQRVAQEDRELEFRVEEPEPDLYRAGFFVPGEPDSQADPRGALIAGAEAGDRHKALVDFAMSLDLEDERKQSS
jgi:hypothetical protein